MISKISTILMFKDIWLKPSRYKHLKSKNVQTHRMISYLASVTYLKSFSGRKDKVINWRMNVFVLCCHRDSQFQLIRSWHPRWDRHTTQDRGSSRCRCDVPSPDRWFPLVRLSLVSRSVGTSSVRLWLPYRAHVHTALGLIVRHGKQARHMRGAIKKQTDLNI